MIIYIYIYIHITIHLSPVSSPGAAWDAALEASPGVVASPRGDLHEGGEAAGLPSWSGSMWIQEFHRSSLWNSLSLFIMFIDYIYIYIHIHRYINNYIIIYIDNYIII